jgi:DNA-binding NarL/FixJ family response regulator
MQRERLFCILWIMNILIASLRKIVGTILATLLSNEPDMNVVGQAENATDLLAQAAVIRPDLVLVEWDLLGPSEADTIRALGRLEPAPDVIVYGQQPDWAQVALDEGADAFVWEGDGPKAMLTEIRRIWLNARYA